MLGSYVVFLDIFYLPDNIWNGFLWATDLPSFPHVPTILYFNLLFL